MMIIHIIFDFMILLMLLMNYYYLFMIMLYLNYFIMNMMNLIHVMMMTTLERLNSIYYIM
jgi:hypothetical protein